MQFSSLPFIINGLLHSLERCLYICHGCLRCADCKVRFPQLISRQIRVTRYFLRLFTR